MEILVSVIIIFGILLIAGVDIGLILLLVLGLVGVLVVLMGLFFAVCLALVVISKLKSAVFLEMDDSGRYPVAVYNVDGARTKNFFPCEMVMRKRLYVPNKKIRILYCAAMDRTIDGNALVTIIAGTLLLVPASVFTVIKFVQFFTTGIVI